VINYQCPEDEKVYLHRIGRTARAGRSGTAVTFVDWDELPRWKGICDALSLPFHEPPETYSTSEHMFIDLDIPTASDGTLPKAERTRAGLDAEEVEDLGETGRGRHRTLTGRRRTRRGESGEAPRHARAGTGAGAGPEDEESTEEPARPRRRRAPRRRTRGGQPVDEAAAEAGTDEAPEAATEASDPAESGTGPARRRRRRRGGRGRGGAGTADSTDNATDEPVGAENS
jgi:superfamily II DNA/RNA helicase